MVRHIGARLAVVAAQVRQAVGERLREDRGDGGISNAIVVGGLIAAAIGIVGILKLVSSKAGQGVMDSFGG